MGTWIGFLRAVNVGKRQVKMEVLRDLLSANGFDEVATHIASGNVRVTTSMRSAAKVEARLRSVITDSFGFDVPVVVRTPKQLVALAEAADGLDSPLGPDARRYVTMTTGGLSAQARTVIEEWDEPGERAVVVGEDVMLFLTKPAHEATLTNARLERLAGVTGTARDLKVVRALAEKWGA
ncbi:MAG: hypothetical protein JWP82_1643 [Humibacillus sp.]|nr:hypothetical protein [Humibacillus sp.]